jgi:uncharacterized protein (TIGR02391 family)
MADIKWFVEKLLELFVKQKEAYCNIFGASQSYLRHILGHAPTEDELVAAQRAFFELRDRGYIYDVSGDHWYIATKDGKEALATGIYKTSAGKRLIEFILDSRILQVSEQAFDSGRFSDSVFNAAKMLEVAIRDKAKLGPEIFGQDLIVDAFHPDKGKLIFPMCEVQTERQGLMHIFMGIIAFLKNPDSHRFTDWINHEIAVRALQSIEFLLKLVDASILREEL